MPAEVGLHFVAEDAEPEASAMTATVRLEGASGSTEVRVDGHKSWKVQASAEGFWSPATIASPGAPDSRTVVPLVLWPAAEIAGKITHPKTVAEPDELRIRLAPVPESKGTSAEQPEGTHWISCNISDCQIVPCGSPPGRWNVRIDSEGLSPLYIWDIVLQPGKTFDLGEIALQLGGSISGRAITALGPVDPEVSAAELHPLSDPTDLSTEWQEKKAQLRRLSDFGAWGDFHFTGVAPGSYRLVIRQEGFAPAERSPIPVEAGEETLIDKPVVLERLLRAVINVQPATDPFQKRWTVNLHRPGEGSVMTQVGSGSTDPAGAWRSPPIPSGPYSVQILDQQGNSMGWWDLELQRGQEETWIDLPIVFVDGRVRMGEEPLSARLWFGGKTGRESIEAETDEDGAFYVVLPREGEWTVDVEADDPLVVSRGLDVEIEPVADLRSADVIIEIPDTAVEGEVVDEVGVAVRSAQVLLQSYGEWRGVLPVDTDLSGRFELRGMRPGQFSIEATSPEGRSEPETRQVAEGQTVSVQLTVRKERTMIGRVLSDSGPVPGAHVFVFPFTNSGRPATMRIPDARTDIEGRFELAVPGGSTSARVLIMAPGYALELTTVNQGTRLEIPLSRTSGTLHLKGNESTDGSVGLVMIDGEAVSAFRLRTWARLNQGTVEPDGSMTIPSMPPGSYAYCYLSLEEALFVLAGAGLPKAEACSEGFLTQNGDLTLELGS